LSRLLFTPPAAPATSPLALHDALPISPDPGRPPDRGTGELGRCPAVRHGFEGSQHPPADDGAEARPDLERVRHLPGRKEDRGRRSEEHTSELQSRFDLVCRLLLEKKK